MSAFSYARSPPSSDFFAKGDWRLSGHSVSDRGRACLPDSPVARDSARFHAVEVAMHFVGLWP